MNTSEFIEVTVLTFSEDGNEITGEQAIMINQAHILFMATVSHEKFGDLLAIQAVNGSRWVVKVPAKQG